MAAPQQFLCHGPQDMEEEDQRCRGSHFQVVRNRHTHALRRICIVSGVKSSDTCVSPGIRSISLDSLTLEASKKQDANRFDVPNKSEVIPVELFMKPSLSNTKVTPTSSWRTVHKASAGWQRSRRRARFAHPCQRKGGAFGPNMAKPSAFKQ